MNWTPAALWAARIPWSIETNITLKNDVETWRWAAEQIKMFNDLIEKDRQKVEYTESAINYIDNLINAWWLVHSLNDLTVAPLDVFTQTENMFNLLNPPAWVIVAPGARWNFDASIASFTMEINNLTLV